MAVRSTLVLDSIDPIRATPERGYDACSIHGEPGASCLSFRSGLESVNELLSRGIDPQFRGKYLARSRSAWRLGMLLDPEGHYAERFGLPFAPLSSETRTNEEVVTLLRQARQNDWRLMVEVNLRGIDGPGSSLDLFRFQVKSHTKGESIGRMHEMPCTTAIASEFQGRFEIGLADEGDEDKIVYMASERLGGRHERRIISDAEELRNEYNLVEMNDVPAYALAKYFGIFRGVKVTCEDAGGLSEEGGMEASNAFVLSVYLMGSMLSGRNWSIAKIVKQSVYDENLIFGHKKPGITGGQGNIISAFGDALTIEWLSGLGGNGIAGDESYIYENDSYGALLFPLHLNKSSWFRNRLFLCQPGKEFLKGGVPREVRLASDTNFEWTAEWDDPVGQQLHLLKKELHFIWRSALEKEDDAAASYALNEYSRIRLALNDRYKEWYGATTGAKADPRVRYMDDYSRRLFQAVEQAGGGLMAAGGGGPGSVCIVFLPEGVDAPAFFSANNITCFDSAAAARVKKEGGVLSGYLPFRESEREYRVSPGWKNLNLTTPAGPRLVALNEETGQVGSLEEFAKVSGIELPAQFKHLSPGARRGLPVEIETAKEFLRSVPHARNSGIH